MKDICRIAIAIALALVLCRSTVSGAAELYVDSDNGNDLQQGVGACDKPYKTLQKAVNDLAAPPADHIIWVQAYHETAPDARKRMNKSYGAIVIDRKSVTIKPYYRDMAGTCKPTETKAVISECDAPNGNPGKNGVHGVLAKNLANVNLRHLEIYGQTGGHGIGTNASGGNGGDGIRAEGGSKLSKFESTADGGLGGKGVNEAAPGEFGGNGARGGDAEKSKDAGTEVKNFFKAKAQGGKGGDGGLSANGPGGSGGPGGAGASTESGGSIAGTPSGQAQGGSGGAAGAGTPPGSTGPSGLDESGLQITDIPEGDADGDGTPDDLDPCPEDPSLTCSPTGSCLVDETCIVATESSCIQAGGTWGGAGTDCPARGRRVCTTADTGDGNGLSGNEPRLAVRYAAGRSAVVGVWLPQETSIALQVYSVAGERMATLHSGLAPAGRYDFHWDGATLGGGKAASGVYFVRMECSGRTLSDRLVLLR